jgi:hypothetical protein
MINGRGKECVDMARTNTAVTPVEMRDVAKVGVAKVDVRAARKQANAARAEGLRAEGARAEGARAEGARAEGARAEGARAGGVRGKSRRRAYCLRATVRGSKGRGRGLSVLIRENLSQSSRKGLIHRCQNGQEQQKVAYEENVHRVFGLLEAKARPRMTATKS